MTIAEKIIARAAGKEQVEPGQLVEARVDLAMANDITAPLAIESFQKMGADRVFDPDRIALCLSHFVPAKDIRSAQLARVVTEFARRQGIRHFFGVGQGIEHAMLPEEGLALPGDLILGADSHTCTYGALGCLSTGVGSTDLGYTMATGETWLRVPESIRLDFAGKAPEWTLGKDFILYAIGQLGVDGANYRSLEMGGEAIAHLSVDSRLTMSNMAVEAGAKCGIFNPDEKVLAYVRKRAQRDYTPVYSDEKAAYAQVHQMEASAIQPQVALPHLPENSVPVSQAEGLVVDQVFIGSCTNGRMEDLRIAAALLRGRRVHPEVSLLVIPASRRIYMQAMEEGLLAALVEAGASVSVPTCGPCLGGHMGVLAQGQRCLSTSNRNFVGRMGHPQSEVYLAGPAVAAATAAAGSITHPGEMGVSFDRLKEEVWA